jgi:hypothetical protein
VSPPPEREDADDLSKKPRRRSRYFGYACARSFELRDRMIEGALSVDDMLDVTESSEMRCPRHQAPCKCRKLEEYWVDDGHGRLALKLFLDHLQGDALLAFKRLVAANLDRLSELKALANEHPRLLAKIKLLAVFS